MYHFLSDSQSGRSCSFPSDIYPGLVTDYVKNSPYCRFNYQTQHGKVEVVFKMNEAGLSKLQADWLVMVKDALMTDAGLHIVLQKIRKERLKPLS